MERATDPRYATIHAAADYASVHHMTIRRWLREGQLPRYTAGTRLVRVDLNDLDALLAGKAGGVPEPDPADVLADYVRKVVDEAPPLSDAQRVRLASLMRSGADSVEAVAR